MNKMEIVTTEFKARPIMERLHQKILEHHRDTGKEPKGLLLGPNEYVDLMGECQRVAPYMYDYGNGPAYPDNFMGIPVRLKSGNGIEVELESNEVFRYAKGLLK